NIAKHRNGRLDSVRLKAILEYQKFVELPPSDNEFIGGFDNPHAGFGGPRQDNLGGNSQVILSSGFQTMQSKANNMAFDDDDEFSNRPSLRNFRPPTDDEEDAPF